MESAKTATTAAEVFWSTLLSAYLAKLAVIVAGLLTLNEFGYELTWTT